MQEIKSVSFEFQDKQLCTTKQTKSPNLCCCKRPSVPHFSPPTSHSVSEELCSDLPCWSKLLSSSTPPGFALLSAPATSPRSEKINNLNDCVITLYYNSIDNLPPNLREDLFHSYRCSEIFARDQKLTSKNRQYISQLV